MAEGLSSGIFPGFLSVLGMNQNWIKTDFLRQTLCYNLAGGFAFNKERRDILLGIKKCDNYDEARELFVEYSKLKGAEVCFVSFENELKHLEEVYSSGVILIAKEDDELIGCIAVKKIADDICELKRLFVRERYRGNGYSKQLFENAITYAKSLGYKKAVINTIPEIMPVGYQMYLRYGFAENFKDENGIVNLSLDL